ncbi:MAG: hypothetical protein Q9198_002897 [Flavoplaca austrocitrina]
MANLRDPFAPDHPVSDNPLYVPESQNLLKADGTPIEPVRQVLTDDNPFRTQVPSQLMRRPGFGSSGKAIPLRLNSHTISNAPDARYYQYDVQIGKTDSKRGLIKNIWASRELSSKIPGGMREWIYDGNKLAWFVTLKHAKKRSISN